MALYLVKHSEDHQEVASQIVLTMYLAREGYTAVGPPPKGEAHMLIGTQRKVIADSAHASPELVDRAEVIKAAALMARLMVENVLPSLGEMPTQADHKQKQGEEACGDTLVVIAKDPTVGLKPTQFELCITCMRKAIAGDEERTEMFSDPKTVRMLLAVMLDTHGIDYVEQTDSPREKGTKLHEAIDAFLAQAGSTSKH